MLIWHPEVHTTFREQLHYYVVTARPYSPDEFRQKMLDFQKKERIGGFCAYEVFGAFDIVLRVWLPLDKLETFDDELRKSAPEIDKIIPFRVTDSSAYWARDEGMSEFKEKALGQITAEHVRHVQNGNHLDLVETYKSSGLLADIEQPKHIKFFIALSNPHAVARTAEASFRNELREIVRAYTTPTNLSRISIYYGFGFAWALIKAETPPDNFFVIGDIVYNLNKKLFPHGFFTTTYIATGAESIETDAISEKSLLSAQGFDLNAARLVPDLYNYDVPDELVSMIIQWIYQHKQLEKLDDNQKDLIIRCLSGVIHQDEKVIFAALQGFFIDMERYLRARWPQFLGSRLGPNRLKEVLRAAKIPEGTNTKWFALGEVCNICAEIIRQSPADGEAQSQLTSGWQDLASLRNVVSHGSCEPLNDWQKMLNTLLDNFPRVELLKATIDQELQKGADAASKK